ncbi:helix-turn-helix domain-containing protein [Desulfosoma sp.]|uniref:Cupin domain-containing protein n=1 Tax=Desulfacinum infernum TaxID=35837 RepID=A0A832A537_9BACT
MEDGLKIGDKLRRLRMENGLTQEELANRAYLTKGFISQLERDLTSPSIATLKSILDVLGVDLAEFFQDMPRPTVVARKKSRVLSSESSERCAIYFLLPRAMGRVMDPVIVKMQKGGRTVEHTPHEGEEFGFVIKGSVTLWFDNKPHRLNVGDCFYFKSSTRHWVENSGRGEAHILWVVSQSRF